MKQTMLKKVLVFIFIMVLAAFTLVGCSDNEDLQGSVFNSNISLVKDGHPELIPYITYKDAYENFFSDPQWRGFESDTGSDIVEFSGGCTYQDEDATVYIQFTIEDDESFYMNYASLKVDGEEIDIDDEILFELLFNPFNQYSIDEYGTELSDDIYYSFLESFLYFE